MKTFLIFLAGAVMLSASTDGITPFIAGALLSWAYYRCGKEEGFKAGKEYLLKGKK